MARASPERKHGELLDRKSMWNSRGWRAIRQGSKEKEVRKHKDRVTGAWKQISKQRRRLDVKSQQTKTTTWCRL